MTTKSMMVRVGADTKDMEKGLSSAQKRIKAFRTSINQIGKRMMVAGAVVAGAIGMMIKNYAKAGDEVHKMALRTGFATETLSELRYASQICGADLGALEKGVKRMSKTINDATKAGGAMATYVRAFDQIGLKAEELIKLSPEDQFDRIARAIANIESPTIRAARAQDIFGRAGTQLLPLFAAGEEGLEALRKKAHELGIVFDQEAANKAAKFTDSMTTLKGALQGIGFAIAEDFMPVLTSLAEHFTDVFVNVRGNTKSFVEGILGFFKILAQGIQGLMLAWTGFKALVFKIAEYAGKVMKAQIGIMTAPLKLLAKIPGKLGEPARLMLKEVGKLTGMLTVITDGYNEAADEQAEKMATIIEQYEAFVKALDNVVGGLEGMKTKSTEAAETITENLAPAMSTLAAHLNLIIPLTAKTAKKVKETTEEFTKAQVTMMEALTAAYYGGIKGLVSYLERLALAEMLKWIFSTIPFPANLVAAAIGMAAVKGLFTELKSFKEGGFIERETVARLHPGEVVLNAPTVKALTSPARETRMATFPFNPTLNFYTKYLDDYAIDHSAEKLFSAWEGELRRRGLRWPSGD